MVKSKQTLDGAVPDKAATVMLILDMLSDFRFKNGAAAARRAWQIAPAIARLKARCGAAGIPTIYVNDNLGPWKSSFDSLLATCLSDASRGDKIAALLRPTARDYCVLKAKHSGFFATPLDTLLQYFGCERLILTGMSAQQCILLTGCDAYVRDYRLWIPLDCIGALSRTEERLSRYFFRTVLKADLTASKRARLKRKLKMAG